MMFKLEDLTGFTIVADDGEVGRAKDFYFDDAEWTVRHLVVDTSGWLPGRNVLVSPLSIERIDHEVGEIRLSLSREQIREGPAGETDRPVSRQFERSHYDYYRWPYYWAGPYAWGYWPHPAVAPRPQLSREEEELARRRQERGDPNLRSFNEVNGYGVRAPDGAMGDIEDLIVDEETWRIRYLLVDTRKWWFGREVLVPPEAVREVVWEDSSVRIDLTREELEAQPEFTSVDDIVEAGETEVLVLAEPEE